MKGIVDRLFLFTFKMSFLIFAGILVLRALNAMSARTSNSYLVSWDWLNSLFIGRDPVGGLIIVGAIISGILYLWWLWWDPLMVRLPKQKGCPWLYHDWEEGLEPSSRYERIRSLKQTILDEPIYDPGEGLDMAIIAFKELKEIDPKEAKNLIDYISENLSGHLKKYPREALEVLKRI